MRKGGESVGHPGSRIVLIVFSIILQEMSYWFIFIMSLSIEATQQEP